MIDKIKDDLRNSLSVFRYQHCLMVADEAKNLAIKYNCDKDKAYLAGLLHDISKEFSDEDNRIWLKESDLDKSLLNEKYKKIIHADIGAVVAREKYHIDDDIYNAIKYHTIGHVPMSTLEKIVFIADKIARVNNNPIVEKTRSLAYQNLDSAIKFFLENQKVNLEKNGQFIHPNSLELLRDLQN